MSSRPGMRPLQPEGDHFERHKKSRHRRVGPRRRRDPPSAAHRGHPRKSRRSGHPRHHSRTDRGQGGCLAGAGGALLRRQGRVAAGCVPRAADPAAGADPLAAHRRRQSARPSACLHRGQSVPRVPAFGRQPRLARLLEPGALVARHRPHPAHLPTSHRIQPARGAAAFGAAGGARQPCRQHRRADRRRVVAGGLVAASGRRQPRDM